MAIEPFFCSLFDEDHNLVKEIFWQDAKKGNSLIWDFFKSENILEKKISFLGGISGPGGFSNLRVSGTILNTLHLKFKTSIHQVRADKVILSLISEYNNQYPENKKPIKILLNSFGKGVFFLEKNNLIRKNIPDCSSEILSGKYCVSFLPENKKELFVNGFEIPLLNFPLICLKTLIKEAPLDLFVPEYEYPPVSP